MVTAFSIINKANKINFFEKTLIITSINLNIDFKIFYFILNSINIDLKNKIRRKSF